MTNPVIEAIETSVKKLPFEFSDNDVLIITEWAYSLYKEGWNNAKLLLKAPIQFNTLEKVDTIKELKRIIDGIEGDTYTADNIQALINKLKQ